MKQVIYKELGKWYITNLKNYCERIQNAREIHELHDINTLEDVKQFIKNDCKRYNDIETNYMIIND